MFIRRFEGFISVIIKKLTNTRFVHFIVLFFQCVGGTCGSFAALRPDQQPLGFPAELLQQHGTFSEPILGFARTA